MEVALGPWDSQAVLWLTASAALAGLAAVHGLRKGSLSPSGATAAFLVGTLHCACGLRFGLVLILFYLSSSKVRQSFLPHPKSCYAPPPPPADAAATCPGLWWG
mmetsp:Transcript_2640/g.7469  ORF Transcript_2640/g.7469 Transcript_2640/m.7469 type:complete len:104 (+) Transcript_2640:182-493(+)